MGFQKYKNTLDTLFGKAEKETALLQCSAGTLRSHTYGDIREICRRFSAVKEKYSLSSGDRIAIVSASSADSLLAYYAVTYQNMTAALIPPTLPKEALVACIKKCDARLVLAGRDLYDAKLAGEAFPVLDIETASFDALAQAAPSASGKPDGDTALFLFSSGTSGIPKPVMISYDAVLRAKDFCVYYSDTRRGDSLLCAFPLYHAGGFFSAFSMSLHRCMIISVEDFSVERTAEYLRRFQPTHFGMIPPVIENLLLLTEQTVREKGARHQRCFAIAKKLSFFARRYLRSRRLSRMLMRPYYREVFGKRMRCIFVGAMKADDALAQSLQKCGLDWYNAYTCTECCCPVVVTDARKAYTPYSNGRIDRNREIKIKIAEADSSGVGEIRVRTPLIMKGYFGDEAATKNAFDEDGFYKTGDLAYTDKHNILHIVGRMSEIIHLHNGEKLSPDVLEDAMAPCFEDSNHAVVCGAPSKDGSFDKIHVFVEDRGYSSDEKSRLNKRLLLASDGYPISQIHYVRQIPYTALHKPKRFALLEMLGAEDAASEEPDTPFEYFLWFLREHTAVSDFSPDTPLSGVTLDSLSVYSLAAGMESRFGIRIIPMLASAATFGQLKEMMVSGVPGEAKPVVLRRIRKDEIRELSALRAECMMDYPLYEVMYADPKRRRRQLLYTSWYMLYRHYPFTYVNEEKTVLFSIKRPGEHYQSPAGLFRDLRFLFGLVTCATPDCIRKIHSYLKIEEETETRHFDPQRDHYICHMCVAPGERRKGIYDSLMHTLDNHKQYYFVTHSEKNARLYEKYGAKICETAVWKGVPHYCLIRYPGNAGLDSGRLL